MNDDDRQGEDVAGLFRKFGGDVKGYREFAPEPQMQEAAPSWRLVSGARQGAPAPAAPVPAAEPAPAPVAPVVVAPAPPPFTAAPASALARPLFARPPVAESVSPRGAPPVAAAEPVAAPTPAPLPTRELDLLFARLDGQRPPQAPAPEAPGLLSRWRRPS